MERPTAADMAAGSAVDSATVRERVVAARERQERRLGPGRCNGEMTLAELRDACRLGAPAKRMLADGHARLKLSGRGHDRVLRLSRTIADLDGSEQVSDEHVARALTLRRRGPDDRPGPGLGAREGRAGLSRSAARPRRAMRRSGCSAAAARSWCATSRLDRCVTIVGSRRASSYGLRVAEELGQLLAAAGLVIVSGMARGIDAAAHRGALAGGGTTIAVLGGGPDVVYPVGERRLYREILRSGAVISEASPGRRPEAWSFPVRNRIMAALAAMTVVVEAAQPSGSLITARQTLDLDRELGAVPGPVNSRVSEGTNDLIVDGAAPIRGAQDVLDRLLGVGVPHARRRGPALEPGLGACRRAGRAGERDCDAVATARGDPPGGRGCRARPAGAAGLCVRRRRRALREHDAETARGRGAASGRLNDRVGQTVIYAGRMNTGGRVATCLSIAGSDSGGGAGIQADLKAFARCGVHGMTAITALTAQSTVGVEMVTPVPPEMIVAQVRAVAGDIGVDGVKVGMLGDAPTIDAVVEALDLVADAPVVVDPVMVVLERCGPCSSRTPRPG